LVIIPLATLILFFIGYASVVTLSIALLAALVFTYRAMVGVSPWQYVIYALLAEALLLWALRPNIRRLLSGTERVVGYRARRKR
jgi:glycerol-3-phosphate acyltransferase PlsY